LIVAPLFLERVNEMIELYSTNVTSTEDMVISWNNKSVQVGRCSTLLDDNQSISINQPGVYEVTVNGYGSVTGGGEFGFQLLGAGVAIARGTGMTTTTGTGVGNVSFSALVKVTASAGVGTAILTVEYTGGAGTINLVNAVVKRVA